MNRLILVFPFLILISGAILFKYLNKTDAPIESKPTNPGEIVCKQNNGNWVAKYNECEGLDKIICEESSGVFNECASVCRNETDPNRPCILLCVAVCSFKSN